MIVLSHPALSVSLRDDTENKNILVLKSDHCTSTIQALNNLYPDIVEIRELLHQEPGLNIRGVMGTSNSKRCQFILVNKREVNRCHLHSIIKRTVASSRLCDKKEGLISSYFIEITVPHSNCQITVEQKKTVVSFRNLSYVLRVFENTVKSKSLYSLIHDILEQILKKTLF